MNRRGANIEQKVQLQNSAYIGKHGYPHKHVQLSVHILFMKLLRLV